MTPSWPPEAFHPTLKIDGCCRKTLARGLEYVWIDSICIDKSSSAELSEAINSMYNWYRKSRVCFVYLSGVSSDANTPIDDIANSNSDFCCSRWFTRGWTLQELIAPSNVVFYNRRWDFIGYKYVFGWGDVISKGGEQSGQVSILTVLRQIINIPVDVLVGYTHPKSVSIATRMMWAARR